MPCAKPAPGFAADTSRLTLVSPRRRRALAGCAAAGAALVLAACRPAPREDTVAARALAGGALRLDFRHSVGGANDKFDLIRLRAEARYGGRSTGPVRVPDWGDYRVSVYDATDTLLFRQGFDSSSADPGPATSALSLHLPMPGTPVRAVIERRRARVFAECYSGTIDPRDPAIDRSPPALSAEIESLLDSGEPGSTVDIAIVGDGYTLAEREKFGADVKCAMGYLFSVEPWASRRAAFNVRTLFVPSAESGVTDRYAGLARQSAFGCTYHAGVAERTLSVGDPYALYEAASAVPHDILLVLANARRYGGSARYGGPAVVAIDSGAARYLVLHELAHVFAGLAEEYYLPEAGGPVYGGNVEPWHPNVTISPAGDKWRDEAGAPPRVRSWNKARYEQEFSAYVRRYFELREQHADEATIDALMARAQARQHALLAPHAPRRIGLYEGAHGYARGVYRAEPDCIMFSLQTDYFCAACTAALITAVESLKG